MRANIAHAVLTICGLLSWRLEYTCWETHIDNQHKSYARPSINHRPYILSDLYMSKDSMKVNDYIRSVNKISSTPRKGKGYIKFDTSYTLF